MGQAVPQRADEEQQERADDRVGAVPGGEVERALLTDVGHGEEGGHGGEDHRVDGQVAADARPRPPRPVQPELKRRQHRDAEENAEPVDGEGGGVGDPGQGAEAPVGGLDGEQERRPGQQGRGDRRPQGGVVALVPQVGGAVEPGRPGKAPDEQERHGTHGRRSGSGITRRGRAKGRGCRGRANGRANGRGVR